MKTKCLLFVILMLLITLVSGCSNNEGDKYIGKWTGLENPDNPRSYIYQISKNKMEIIILSKERLVTTTNLIQTDN